MSDRDTDPGCDFPDPTLMKSGYRSRPEKEIGGLFVSLVLRTIYEIFGQSNKLSPYFSIFKVNENCKNIDFNGFWIWVFKPDPTLRKLQIWIRSPGHFLAIKGGYK